MVGTLVGEELLFYCEKQRYICHSTKELVYVGVYNGCCVDAALVPDYNPMLVGIVLSLCRK